MSLFGITKHYVSLCTDAKVAPIPFIFELLKNAEELAQPLPALHLPGNRRNLFNNRLGDAHAQIILQLFSTGKYPEVRDIDLSYNQITDESATFIAELITNHPGLERLSLGGNDLTCRGVGLIADALPSSSLQELVLRENNLGDDGIMFLASALQFPNKLSALDVAYTDMGIKGLLALLEPLLAHATTLRSLKLDNLRIKGCTRDAFIYIARLCASHTTLEELSLAKTFCDDEAFATLTAYGLTKTSSIRTLGLRCNTISESSAENIARLLQENQSIQFLDLSANKIGDEVAISLAEILPAHPQLDTLDISANRIGDLGLAALAASLIQPPHLRALRAWGNDFAKNAAEAFTVLAAEAPALQLDVQPYEVDGVFQVAQV